MSRNNLFITTSKPPARRQQRLPVAPQSGPILLPNLSPRPTLDEDLLGSPEFRDALQAAKQSRSNDDPSNHLLRSPLCSDTLPSHSTITLPHDDSVGDHTRRMQTCVAVRDNLKSPHQFQIIPLHEVKRLRVPVRPTESAVPSRKLSTTREKRKTGMAPQLRGYATGYTTTSTHPTEITDYATSGAKHLTNSPLRDRLTTSHSENYINDKHEPHVYGTTETSGLGIMVASPGYNQPPPALSHKGRALSELSGLGSTQDLAGSSSLRDIQVRAASSTKNRRKTQSQSQSDPSTNPVVSVRPRKSLDSPKASDSLTNQPRESFAKRRAIYAGSMYLDSPATFDATCRDENQNVYPQVSVHSRPSGSSVLSQTEDMHQSIRSPRERPSKVHLGKDVPKRRAPLVSVDLNMQTKRKSSSTSHHTSMPPSTFFVSRSSSFLSTDPFAGTTVCRRRGSESPETVYHPIVLDLLAALDVAIGEWNVV